MTENYYDEWKKARASVFVPEDFTERVMTSVKEHVAPSKGVFVREAMLAVLSSKLGRAAIWILACLVFAVRIGSVLALLH